MNMAIAVILVLAVLFIIFSREFFMKKAGIKPAKKDKKKDDHKK